MRHQRLLIRSVKLEETLVTDYMDQAMDIFKANIVGPQKYLNCYKKYQELLNNKAELEVTAFLKETHSLQGFKKVGQIEVKLIVNRIQSCRLDHDKNKI